MYTKIHKQMKVSQIIIEKLLNDKEFRLKTALALRVSERNIIDRAKVNSDNLTKMAAVNVYKEYGFTEEEIFEVEKAK